jgi:hypothetical protein
VKRHIDGDGCINELIVAAQLRVDIGFIFEYKKPANCTKVQTDNQSVHHNILLYFNNKTNTFAIPVLAAQAYFFDSGCSQITN